MVKSILVPKSSSSSRASSSIPSSVVARLKKPAFGSDEVGTAADPNSVYNLVFDDDDDTGRAEGLDEIFQFTEGYASNSASHTDIWEAVDKRTGKSVILKVFIRAFHSVSPTGESRLNEVPQDTTVGFMRHEIQTYHSLRQYLLFPYNVRNIVCAIGEGTFSSKDAERFLTKGPRGMIAEHAQVNLMLNALHMLKVHHRVDPKNPMSSKVGTRRPSISKRHWTTYPSVTEVDAFTGNVRAVSGSPDKLRLREPILYGCLITPKLASRRLVDWLDVFFQQKPTSHKSFANYLFVLFATIWALSSSGVNQNDLHWGNVLMEDKYYGPSALHVRQYFVIYNEELIVIDNPYVLFIYDFDRASVHKQSVHAMIRNQDWLMSGGNCPEYHPTRDILKQLCQISAEIKRVPSAHPSITSFRSRVLEELIRTPALRMTVEFDSSCHLSDMEDDFISVMCKPSMMNEGLHPLWYNVEWMLQETAYRRFPISEISAPSNRDVFIAFRKQFKDPNLTKEYVAVNTQFLCRNQKFGEWHKDPAGMGQVLSAIAAAVQQN